MESKYKYEFATETVEIEIADSWGAVLAELDRLEHNNNQTETRRHCSLNALNLDDAYLPSDVNVERTVLSDLENEALEAAIAKLAPRHRFLVIQHFFSGRSISDIAKEHGLDESAIRHALKRAQNNLKKFLI